MSAFGDALNKPVVIFGCGNTLIGDDGFGPAVVGYLPGNYELPADVAVIDAGTSIREFLFDMVLMPGGPRLIFIVDTVLNSPYPAGEIFELDVDAISSEKVSDFSPHQFPSLNLLSELRQGAGVRIRVLAVQAGKMPEEVYEGLSAPVAAAVPKACEWLLGQIEERQ